MRNLEAFNKWKEETKAQLQKFNQKAHGERVRDLRKLERITQEQLAEVAEVDVKTVRYIENGERILAGDAAIKIYLKWGYFPDWIYGISELRKDADRPYYVDIRDLIQIHGDHITISIKKHLFELLEHSGSFATSEIQSGEDCVALCQGIEKQKRLFAYSNNNSVYYCANIPVRNFEKEESAEGKDNSSC